MSMCRILVALPAVGLILSSCGGGGGGGGTSKSAEHAPPAGQPEKAAPAAAPAGEFGTSTIRGHVMLEGAAPAAQTIKMDADPYCSLQHTGGAETTEYVVGSGGSLKWVFVHVKEGIHSTYAPPSEPVVLDQKGCIYEPHVIGIMAGQTLKILNSDATLHNIHSFPQNSRSFNLAMPNAGMEIKQEFRNPEVMVRIKCDVHPWMESFAGVVAHPFHGVTGEDGTFNLARLPAGTYTIEAWHEAAGSQTQKVTVAEGETKEIMFSFKASPA
jgi:plastocyanin